MSGRPNRRQTVVAPIHFIFNLLETQQPVSIWLYEKLDIRMEGKIRGFDEFMNLVVDDAVEVTLPTPTSEAQRRHLGQILLKGDNVSLIQTLRS